MKFAEEFTMPSTNELQSLENWSNMHATILKIGRTTHLSLEPPEDMPDDQKEQFLARIEEDKQDEAPFRTINEH